MEVIYQLRIGFQIKPVLRSNSLKMNKIFYKQLKWLHRIERTTQSSQKKLPVIVVDMKAFQKELQRDQSVDLEVFV